MELARRSTKAFAQIYLPHHCECEFGEHHDDLFALIDSPKKAKRAARVEPRGHGKSTVMTLIAPLKKFAFKEKECILLIGSSATAIGKHFSTLQEELDPETGNELLLEDFPHLRPAIDFKGHFVSWTDSKMRLSSGATLLGVGLYSSFRGAKEGRHRADLIIFDDPQDEDGVATFLKRQRAMNRFRRTILNLGEPDCDVIVEGNLMHKESLVAELLRDKNVWDGKLYRAENLPKNEEEEFPIGNTKEDGSPLWPARWSVERLEAKKAEIQSSAYAIEFLNKIRAEEDIIYDSSQFQRFDLLDPLRDDFMEFDDSFEFILFWDPADPKTRDGQTCFCGMTVLATKKIPVNGDLLRYYWIPDVFLKRAVAEEQVEVALDKVVRWPIRRVVYEKNGGFGMIRPYLIRRAEERGIVLNLRMYDQVANKPQRIGGAQAVIMNRTFFARNLSPVYFDQWDSFPQPSSFIDGPDSTVSAIEQYEKSGRGFVI